MMKKDTTAVSIRTTSDSSSEQVLLGQGKKQSVFKKVVQAIKDIEPPEPVIPTHTNRKSMPKMGW
ncbi:uncharacterized protein AB675_9955 [Cyphellophora attinorum]|uniref:Uncharacterized protein n=1 Tax=Cyphellophora attinorum TaxID=1664694 RepID=A0A0N1HLG3_9EURO|nr:uncharacterized protein AB675_9955 [Phialophora attinorum]KPI35360.1 hypothetical protein AB675_9955 [Phialophora attinorum]